MFRELLKLFPIRKFKISGHSMEPLLKADDKVLASYIPYFFSNPKIGDLIALISPTTQKTLIKRIKEVENDSYFITGDNANDSHDSRSFGWIRKKDIIGKVIYNSKVKI